MLFGVVFSVFQLIILLPTFTVDFLLEKIRIC